MRIRLNAPFFYNNHRYDIGDIVDLAEGIEGPHGSRQVTLDRISYDTTDGLDANRLLGKVEREPLFEVVEEKAHESPEINT
jgi:hypothetical protein